MDTVFFIVAKLAGAALKVETWLLILALAAFWRAGRARAWGARRASGLLALAIVVIGALPLGDLLLRPLEASVPIEGVPDEVAGIIVLGGGEDVPASVFSGQPQIGEGGERYMAAIALARRHIEARLLFAGGSGRLRDAIGAPVSEAEIAKRIFLEQGLAPERLLFESRSRNTAENARLALELARPEPNENWLLVTSAFHMPRALRSFEAVGWNNITAYPVDYRTRAWRDGLGWNFDRNLEMLNKAIREWVGRAAYTVAGR